ncbi:MAG: patatin-like phospholipase family protein [Nitrospirae bacterium]|nr:patatin-like phospholipase family protein [Nitrospirota bacterium]
MVLSPKRDMQPKTALVLCGGGSRGALEVGLYQALAELGVKIDLVAGTSIGAINGAFIAAGVLPEQLAALWINLNRKDLYSYNWRLLWKLFRADSLYDNQRLRDFLKRHLPATHFDDLKIPLIVTGTEFQTGEPVYFEEGNLIEALMASSAMPGLFPPVDLTDRQIIDGGVSNNVPLDVAIDRGADTVIFMLCICCEQIPYPVRGLANMINYAFSIAVDRKFRSDVRHFQDKARLIMMEPQVDLDVGLLDFSHSGKLIELGYGYAMTELRKHGFGRPKIR